MKRLRIAAAAVFALIAVTCARTRESSADVPVFIVSIDTLRADHLSVYGYRGGSTPHIDAFRRDAILFENAYSPVPLTLPAHTSIMTGRLPFEHGVRNNLGFTVSADTPTLATVLGREGYDTGAAVSAYVLRRATGIANGFAEYDDAITLRGGESFGQLQRPGLRTLERAEAWLAARQSKKLFFFLHLFEPHSPYEPPAQFAHLGNPYDGEIAAADDVFGRFVADLKSRGIYDQALIILLSDHGEGLGDHGEDEHGIFVYREAIHVPLLVKLPMNEQRGSSAKEPVQLTDVFPTICDVAGVDAPPGVSGRSLMGTREPSRRVYAESLYARIHLGWAELRSLIDDRLQYIEAPKPELYDNLTDPTQRNNILAERRRDFARLRSELQKLPRGSSAPSAIDPEEAKRLAALGYLGSSASSSSDLDPKDRIGDIAMVKTAARAAADGKLDEAVETYRRVLANNAQFADAWNGLADALEKRADFSGAIDARRRAVQASPALAADSYLSISADYLSLGDLRNAEEFATLALRTAPAPARLQLARIAYARGDLAAAEKQAREAAADADTKLAASVTLAQVLSSSNRAAEALAVVEQIDRQLAARGEQGLPSLELARGDALARLDRVEQAEAAFRREIERYPSAEHAYLRLIILETLQGNVNDARAVARRLVAVRPDRRAKVEQTLAELGVR